MLNNRQSANFIRILQNDYYPNCFDNLELKDVVVMAAEYGYGNGYGIADSNWYDFEAIVSQAYDPDDDPFMTYAAECSQKESDHFRQFSPFELYAKQ